jgi:hypothetical protein
MRENGSPFRERASICHKEKRGTCLVEVRNVVRGQFNHVSMKNGSLPKEPDVGGPLSRTQGLFMTCDLGRRVSRTPWWKASVSSYVAFAVAIQRTSLWMIFGGFTLYIYSVCFYHHVICFTVSLCTSRSGLSFVGI